MSRYKAIMAKVREELAKEASEKLDEIRDRVRKVSTELPVKWLREEGGT